MPNNKIIKKIYFIEGNMGAGKSTLLASLDKNKYNILDEPMELFCNLKNFNPLDMFYNKTLSCFSLSVYIISIFFNILLTKTRPDKINIICRNPFSTVLCFAKLSKNSGQMAKVDYEILNSYIKTYEYLLKDMDVKFVYLQASPEVCYKRLKKRNRKEENNVTIEYIKELDKVYNEYISEINNYPLIIINASFQDPENIKEIFLKQLL